MSAVSQAPHTGTTIVACEYDGGVVLGADTRVSTGAFVYATTTTTRDSSDSSVDARTQSKKLNELFLLDRLETRTHARERRVID